MSVLGHRKCAKFLFFRKGSGNGFSTTFRVWYFKKNIFHVIFYLTIFHCLIVLTSWDIRQDVEYVCNCLSPRLQYHNFEISLIFLIKPFFYMTKTSRQTFKYLENEHRFSDEIKSIFHNFWVIQLLKVVSVLRVCL